MLERDPNRLRTYVGAARAAERSGERKKAAEYAKRVLELTQAADTPLAEITLAKELLAR